MRAAMSLLAPLLTLGSPVSAMPQQDAMMMQEIVNAAATSSPPLAYTGPGDVVSGALVWYGLRAYSNASVGNSAIDIQRNSDSATCTAVKTFAAGGSIGQLDVSVGVPCSGATVTAFCNATTCTVTKFYDQSGNGRDSIQATVGQQATLFLNSLSTMPVAQSIGKTGYHTTTTITNAQPVTIAAVANRVTGTAAGIGMVLDKDNSNGPGPLFGWASGANLANCSDGQVSNLNGSATDNAYHSLICVVNGASSTTAVDGTGTTGSLGGTSVAGPVHLFATSAGAQNMAGNWVESGAWGTAFNSTQYAAMSSNAHAFWGF